MVAEVIINSKAKKLNRTFDYNIPKELENMICELANYKVYMAYKIGLVDGIKIKNKCT